MMDHKEKPDFGCLLGFLFGTTAVYLYVTLVPPLKGGIRRYDYWVEHQPTWGTIFVRWALIVVPITIVLWFGYYLSPERFGKSVVFILNAVRVVVAVVALGLIVAIVGHLFGLI